MARLSGLMIILVSIVFLVASGCVTHPPIKNASSTLPPIYTAPIGGFEPPFVSVVEPNTILEIDYIFYSRN